MATTVNVLLDGPRHLSVLFTGDAEDLTTGPILKVDRSATSHTEPAGPAAGSAAVVPRKTLDVLGIEEVYWSVDGYDNVTIQWNFNAGDETALVLGGGEGYISFLENGILTPSTARDTAQAADGDVQFIAPATGATFDYTLKIRFRKKWVD